MPRRASKKKSKTGCEVVRRFQNDLRRLQNGLSEGLVMKTAWNADREQAGSGNSENNPYATSIKTDH